MSGFDYDEGDIHRRYDRARGLPAPTLEQWMKTLARLVGPEPVRAVVDVGCGTGRFSLALAREFGARVYGVEPSSKMLEVARAALEQAEGEDSSAASRVEFLRGVAERLPLDEGVADLVFLSMVYHHIADKPRACAEFRRV
ncbi:MAG TPA: class I SAM-dependent methyltransferase, partial [Pyrinomonadaceae bacterium]|nr:class I SAM-dependent methyltransferase [Pyrinomonadaceae bacterium]